MHGSSPPFIAMPVAASAPTSPRSAAKWLNRQLIAIAWLAAGLVLARPATAANDSRPSQGSVTLDVLTFNLEGLAWPARKGRAPSLARIGSILADLRKSGDAPDVILVQEMFSPAAKRAVAAAGYQYVVTGPGRTQRKRMVQTERVPGPRGKGEFGFHLLGSGLAILSRYPIISTDSEPFGKRACAGVDCLSNKGVLHARIAVPGVPQPINLVNTHLNAQSASRATPERQAAAHRIQVEMLRRFARASRGAGEPAIVGGDFNMKNSEARFETFSAGNRMGLVHEYCTRPDSGCDVRVSWDGDAPWMDTQDLQFFATGTSVSVIPTHVEAMFDGSAGSPKLSDHDGFRVRYTLNWSD
jgi:endonuclease/exonuclease/phosphatase family metal-dependent hydrolase